MASDPAGERFGQYRVLSEIGSGGMGVVYRAAHVETGAQVAIKTVRLPRPWLLSTLRREITALTRINHPGVIRIVDQGLDEGIPWYAMELHSGRTLEEFRDRFEATRTNAVFDSSRETTDVSGGLAPVGVERAVKPRPRRPANPWLGEALSVVRRLCATLAFVHGRGIVHRDLKPANVLLRRDGTPVLTDFGLVFHLGDADGRRTLDLVSGRQGTPAYMAPELARGAWGDARVDLYALGCVLYELVTGAPPFAGGSATEVIEQHLASAPIPPSELAEEVPHTLERLILDLLEKDPLQRLSYADDVARVLDDLGVTGGDSAFAGWPPRPYLYRADLAGRAGARERLSAAVGRAAAGLGGVLLIGGKSGEGKTTLASAACAMAADEGLEVVTSVCAPVSRGGVETSHGAPLHAFNPLIRVLIDHCVSEGPEATARLLGPRGGALAVYEPALATVLHRFGLPVGVDVPIDALQELVLTTFVDVIGRFAERRPLLLVIDDLQWADELSLKLLASLGPSFLERRPLLIVGTFRTDEISPELGVLQAQPAVEKIELTPLEEKDVRSIVGQMLGTPEPPVPLSRFLARCSGGNPLFVCEYLGAAVEDGRLRRTAARWEFDLEGSGDPGEEGFEQLLGLAPSVHALILRRLDATTAAARALLELASVFGKRCSVDLLLAVVPGAEDERLAALDELLRHRLLEQAGGTVLFVHDRIRDVTYEHIAADRRPALHRTVALALEDHLRANPDTPSLLGELADHWKNAGDPARQIEWLEKSADHALRTSAYRDAQARYAELLSLQASGAVAVEPMRVARWHTRLAEAAKNLDDFGTGRANLKAALSALGWPVPESRVGLGIGTLIEVGRQVVRRVRYRWTTPRVKESPESAMGAHASYLLLETSRSMGDPLLPLYATMRALNLAEQGAPPALLGRAYALLQIMLSSAGAGRVARRYGPLTDSELARTPDAAGRLDILLMKTIFCGYTADVIAGIPLALETQQLADRLGYRRRWEEATYTLANHHYVRANLQTSRAAYEDLLESSRRGAKRVRVWALGGLAVTSARLGLLGEARKAVDELIELLPDLEMSDAPLAHGTAGIVCLREGDRAGARRWADSCAAFLAHTPDYILEQQSALTLISEIYVTLLRDAIETESPEVSTLERAATRAIGKTATLSKRFPSLGPDAAYWSGEMEWLRKRPAAARRRWTDALARAEALAMPLQQANAHLALSRLNGADASHHRELAMQIFGQAGIPVDRTVDSPERTRSS